MRLGFHYHLPAQLENGKIKTLSLQGLFIDSLAPKCERIVLFLYKPLPGEIGTLDYIIHSENVELVSLVKHYAIPVRLALSPWVRYKVNKKIHAVDVMLLRAPTPLLPLIIKDIKKKIPFSYLVVGEMIDHIDNIPQAAWRKGFLKRYILWNEGRQRHYASEALVFANSAIVYEKYQSLAKRAVLIHTTTLKKSDFFVREDTCQQKPLRILFAGRIERGKGILEITEAVGRLNQREGVECLLDIVGWSEQGDPTPRMVKKLAEESGIAKKVIFHGKKKVGQELFDYYRKADIFVLASQVAEGFPRTIWEALASSVPVISTPVGSVPYFLKDTYNVLLITPKSVEDIVAKVKLLVSNSVLRKGMIKNGLERVNDVTLEIQAEKISKELKSYIENQQLKIVS